MGGSTDPTAPLGFNEMRTARENMCRDIPVSTAQCEQGWMELCAFVDGAEEVACWRPSPRSRLAVWKRLVEGAVLQGIDLEKQFLVGDLWKSVLDDDEDMEPPFPRALLEAVVRRICISDERPPLSDDIKCELKKTVGCGCRYRTWLMILCYPLGASFDKVECTQWVGETYLAATAPTTSSAIGRSELLRAWKDCLPETWRGEVALSKLPVTRPFPPMSCGAIADFDYRTAATTVLTLQPSALLNPRNGSQPIKLPLHRPQPRRLRIPETGTNCSKAGVDCKKKKKKKKKKKRKN